MECQDLVNALSAMKMADRMVVTLAVHTTPMQAERILRMFREEKWFPLSKVDQRRLDTFGKSDDPLKRFIALGFNANAPWSQVASEISDIVVKARPVANTVISLRDQDLVDSMVTTVARGANSISELKDYLLRIRFSPDVDIEVNPAQYNPKIWEVTLFSLPGRNPRTVTCVR